MKRAALYARVSTEIQAREGDSIQAQISALKKYASDHNYEIAGIFTDDGISGTLLTERDELQNLLDAVRQRKVDLILFTRLDRWFRSIRHYLNTQDVLDKYNVPWKAIWEQFETQTPQGRFMVNQTMSFAQYESETTAVRIKHVFDYKKSQHEVLSGKVPFGYKIENKHMVPDPDKADIARQVFSTYIETGSMCETMKLFQGHGLPKTQSAIKAMLSNRKYIGEAYGIENYIEPIIDKQTFKTVQHMLSANVKKSQVRNYIFTGLVWCADCGKRMTGTSDVNRYKGKNERYKVYRCMYHYRPIPTCDNTNGINEKKLEKYLVANLKNLAFADISAHEEDNTKDYGKQIAAVEKKMSRLKELYVNELINLDEYKRDLAAYKAEIDDFKKRMERYEDRGRTALKELVGMNLDEWYWTLSISEKRTLWLGVIDKIWYGSDKVLKVDFR